MKSWEEKKKDLFKLGARSANPNIRTTRIMVGTDVSIPGGIRGTTRGYCQHEDALWISCGGIKDTRVTRLELMRND